MTAPLLVGVVVLAAGCVHHIHVAASPPGTADRTVSDSAQVVVSSLTLEGADHMPGIGLLEWPAKDLQSATIAYLQQRKTFASVGKEAGDLRLTMRAWLKLKSRRTYVYSLRLEADLGPAGQPPVKSYIVEKEADGSFVRWVTSSDQEPIQQTVQAALDDLSAQIERDASLLRNRRN